MNFQESVIHIGYARYSYDYWYPRLFVFYIKEQSALGTCLMKQSIGVFISKLQNLRIESVLLMGVARQIG